MGRGGRITRKEFESRGGKIKLFQPEFGLPMILNDEKPGRNQPCPCGSKKKYKKCCLQKPAPEPTPEQKAHAEQQHAVQQALASSGDGK